MKANENKFIIQSITYSAALLLISGSVIQSFLLENGLSETVVTLYLSIVQMVQVGAMLVVSQLIDSVKNVLRLSAFSTLFQIGMYLALILLCVFNDITLTLKYTLVFSAGIFTNIIQAIYNIVSYKTPYHIIDMRRFGYLTAVLGVLTGIICSVITAIMSYFTKNFDYNTVMLISFTVGAIIMLASYIIIISFKDIKGQSAAPQKPKRHVNLLKYKPFTVLILPNLFRGFCTGLLSVCMTIGFSLGITDKSSGATLSMLLQISLIVSCLIYAFLSKKNIDGLVVFVSSALLFAVMPFMFSGGMLMFYTVYIVANFFINFVNYAVPVVITKVVDYDYMGAYSSWRMIIHTLGIALSNILLTPMLKHIGPVWIFLIAGVLQLISGIFYYVFSKRNRIEMSAGN